MNGQKVKGIAPCEIRTLKVKTEARRQAWTMETAVRLQEAHRFFDLLWPEGLNGSHFLVWRRDSKTSLWFRDLEKASTASVNLADKTDVYFGCGLSPKAFGDKLRCESKDVCAIPGFWADVDFGDGHKKAVPPTQQSAEELIDELPLRPSVVVHSGHGFQAWWLFKEHWAFPNQAEHEKAARFSEGWQRLLHGKAEARGWKLDSTYELARILRCPGTLNHKHSPICEVSFHRVNEEVKYDPSQFEEWTAEPQSSAENVTTNAANEGDLIISEDRIPPTDILDNLREDKKFNATWLRQRGDDLKDKSPSGYDMATAVLAALARCNRQTIADLIIFGRKRNKEDSKLRTDYLKTTIDKAILFARKLLAEQLSTANIEKLDASIMEAIAAFDSGSDEQKKDAGDNFIGRLRTVLGFDIIRFVKHPTGDDPVFRMDTPEGNIILGEADAILSFTKFRVKIAAFLGIVIPDDKPMRQLWNGSRSSIGIAQMIFRLCEEEDVGRDVTSAAAATWVEGYLESNPATEKDENKIEKSRTVENSVSSRGPFIHNGWVYLYGDDLRKWLDRSRHEKISAKHLGLMMRRQGYTPEIIPLTVGGERTSRYVWRIIRIVS